jgi:hypothetical protein
LLCHQFSCLNGITTAGEMRTGESTAVSLERINGTSLGSGMLLAIAS